MIAVRRFSLLFAFPVLFLSGRPASASPISDFQARLGQTSWNLQTVERMVRAQPFSSETAQTPEALDSHLTLLSENVTVLARAASARVTNDQRRVFAEGLKSAAAQIKDLTSMAINRGLAAAASSLALLETNCRVAIAAL